MQPFQFLASEPLEQTVPRLSILPIQYPDIMDMLEKAQDLFWKASEVDKSLNIDKQNADKLEPKVKKLLEYLLAFFAVSDGLVNENIEHCFGRLGVPEIRAWYHFQEAMEDIHNLVYGNLVKTYCADYLKVLDAVKHYPNIAEKVQFIREHSTAPRLGKQIFMNCIMEGLFFSASFCVIFWTNHKSTGLPALPGLAKANEFISRDEGLHADFSAYLYNKYIVNKLSEAEAHDLIRHAVEIESRFIAAALPEGLPGMNSVLMTQYLQFVADQLLRRLHYSGIWNVEQPFPFMQKQSVSVRMTDFFVSNVTEYGQAGGNEADNELVFD